MPLPARLSAHIYWLLFLECRLLLQACTNFGHLAVDGVHSIENKADRITLFALTLFPKGVKP